MKFNFRIFWTSFIFFVILFSFMDLARAQWYYGTGEATNLENTIGFNLNTMKIITGETADPSSAGYVAGMGSVLLRENGGSFGEAWLKAGSSNTGWKQIVNKDSEGKLTGHGSAIVGKDQYRQYFNDGEAEYSLATRWSTGDNASFMGGGALTGSFSISLTNINTIDQRSFMFTQGSLDEYVASKQFAIDVPITAGIAFDYQYNGADNDIEVELYCTSLSTAYSVGFLEAADGITKPFSGSVYVPTGCGVARIGFSVAVLNAGKILYFNRMIVSNNPFAYKNLLDTQMLRLNTATGYGSTNNKIRIFTNTTAASGGGLFSYATSAADGDSFTILKDCTVAITYIDQFNNNGYYGISKNSTELTTTIDTITMAHRLTQSVTIAANYNGMVGWTGKVSAGDILRPHTQGLANGTSPARTNFTITAIAESEHVVTPAKSGIEEIYIDGYTSKDASGYILFKTVRRNTLSALAAYSVAASYTKLTATKKVIATIASSAVAGVTIHPFIYHYNSANTLLSQSGFCGVAGQEATGVLPILMNVGDYVVVQTGTASTDSAATNFRAIFVDFEQQILSAIPTTKVCYLKDVKASGTAAGTSSTAGWYTRDLTVINENGGITSSSCSFATLSANQFTLQPGQYKIRAESPTMGSTSNAVRLYNISTSQEILYGVGNYSASATEVGGSIAQCAGTITITTPQTYAVQYQVGTSRASNGLGVTTSWGAAEIFTTVEITKLR
jgi:hypothetical protein